MLLADQSVEWLPLLDEPDPMDDENALRDEAGTEPDERAEFGER
jgi:hypothetical protein